MASGGVKRTAEAMDGAVVLICIIFAILLMQKTDNLTVSSSTPTKRADLMAVHTPKNPMAPAIGLEIDVANVSPPAAVPYEMPVHLFSPVVGPDNNLNTVPVVRRTLRRICPPADPDDDFAAETATEEAVVRSRPLVRRVTVRLQADYAAPGADECPTESGDKLADLGKVRWVTQTCMFD